VRIIYGIMQALLWVLTLILMFLLGDFLIKLALIFLMVILFFGLEWLKGGNDEDGDF